MQLSAEHYFRAGVERMKQARLLYAADESYALAMYAAGLAVECVLRTFRWTKDASFEGRHDLLRSFKESGLLQINEEKMMDDGATGHCRTRSGFMDLRKKVERALKRALNPSSRLDLESDDGIIGVVVSKRFRDIEPYDRQLMIDKALRHAPTPLDDDEMRQVIAIAGLTPEEYVAYAAR